MSASFIVVTRASDINRIIINADRIISVLPAPNAAGSKAKTHILVDFGKENSSLPVVEEFDEVMKLLQI